MKEKKFFVFALDCLMTKVAFGVTGEVARSGGADKRTIFHVVDNSVFKPVMAGSIEFSSDIGLCSLRISPSKRDENKVVVTIGNESCSISHEMTFNQYRDIVFGAKYDPDLVVRYKLT